MNSSRNSFEMVCFSRFIILQRCGYAIFICSKSCKLLINIRNTRIFATEFLQNFNRMVDTAIVYENKFEIIFRNMINNFRSTLIKFMKYCFFVITRY